MDPMFRGRGQSHVVFSKSPSEITRRAHIQPPTDFAAENVDAKHAEAGEP
jgi:hypothetical protein